MAAITASVHAAVLIAAGLQIIPTERPERSIAIADTTTELRHPLIVTGFYFENTQRSLNIGSNLIGFGLADPNAIRVPLPELPNVDAVAADSFERSRNVASVDDLRGAERLQGVYVGQIKARVMRLLEASTFASFATSMPCVIHIVQNERGEVFDVQTDECAADAAWRDGIASAIRQASPLPIPPAGLAMGSYLTLDLSRP
ncbi:MAG: hypothetical protein ACREXP_19735 [Steroidobacteraceae bacterium]